MKTIKKVNNAFFLFLTSIFLGACATSTVTQTDSIEFLTAFSEVGSSSRTAKAITPKLEEYLGSSIELKHSRGRTAGIGAAPDGKTIVISSIGLTALLPAVLDDYELDPFTDLRPITRVAETPDILVVRSALGINNIDELIAYTKDNPTALKYFHIAPTSIHRLEFAAIFGELGVSASLDPSRANGNDDAMSGIVDGTLDLLSSTSPYMTELIATGAAVPLLVIHPTRMPLFPDVPTLLELGATTMSSGSWSGLFAPAGTSDEDLNRIFNAMKFAMDDPATVAAINELGMEINLSESPDEFSNFLELEMQRLKSAADQYQFSTD